MRILLAEDEVALSRAIVKIFNKSNYSVDAVYDGEEALSYLESGNYDVAVLDIMMPKMDGISLVKEIQKMTLNKTAIVKYDAFKDVGGKLSFALAMLDKENSGFVLNAIHSREGCYTYVKEIVKGESYIVLGEEEKEALRQAVNAHNDIG